MPFRTQLNQLKTKLENLNREHNLVPFGQGSGSQPQQQQQHYQNPQQQNYPVQQSTYGAPSQSYQQQQYYPGQQPAYGTPPQPNQQQYYPGAPQQGDQYGRPPPIPQHSHPSLQGQPQQQPINQKYWTARFDPATAISDEWEHKEGNNNGWGNAELETYTRNTENSFYTGDNKLILRAIAHNGNYTSARLVSRRTLGRPRGCLTTILTMPSAIGIWPAFWLLPREPFTWPHDGEVDIAEAWNAENKNHACLHWGFYTAEDHQKHLVKVTDMPNMGSRAIRFDFVWHESGRLVWYIDNQAVMKATTPQGIRKMDDWCVVMNVAMGGTVCGGQIPRDGAYDLVVHTVYMCEEPELGGWGRFEADWQSCPPGNTM